MLSYLEEPGGDMMETVLLLLGFLVIGAVGMWFMKRLDMFTEENSSGDSGEPQGEGSMEGFLKNRSGAGLPLNALNILKSMAMIVLASVIGFGFWKLGFSEANIIMVYILCVMITSVITTRQIYSLISSMISVFVFNFLFTEPRYTLLAYEKDYPVTFITMFVAAFMTGSLAIQLKSQIRQSAEAALVAQKEQMRANLLRSISHDLRTPLTSISGNASNLLSNGERFDEETKMQLYSDIYEDSMWLINLVENILSVTKLEEDKLNIRLSTELLDEIITEALQHISRKKIEHTILVETPDEFIFVKVDTRLIMQVIINIVDNAIKYTQKGSKIVITTEKQLDKAVVRIADNGPGIPDEKKEQVFDMFYSGAKNIADSRRSLGLGLALCRSIISAHGGELKLSDHVPHGAVFTFTLPIEEVDLHE